MPQLLLFSVFRFGDYGRINRNNRHGVYLSGCKALGIKGHPARFPAKLPQFFIRMLTDPGDVVLDIFAGSNTAGMVAEQEQRKWLAFEMSVEYLAASSLRFLQDGVSQDAIRHIYDRILIGESVDIRLAKNQTTLVF